MSSPDDNSGFWVDIHQRIEQAEKDADQGRTGSALATAREVEGLLRRSGDRNLIAAGLKKVADLCEKVADYETACRLFQERLGLVGDDLGEDHPAYGRCLSDLANLFKRMGNFTEAESYFKQAADHALKAMGEQHPGYGRCLHELGLFYSDTDRYEDAEKLLAQVMDNHRRALGIAHKSLGHLLNNLGLLCKRTGRFNEAVSYYEEATRILRRSVPERHPIQAVHLNNIASLYDSVGIYDRAQECYQEGIHILEQAGLRKDPQYALLLNNVGLLYFTVGEPEKAVPFLERAVSIRSEALGPKSPLLASSLDNLALCLGYLNQFDEAEGHHRQAIQILSESLGADHPATALRRMNLALLLHRKGEMTLAEAAIRDALVSVRRAMGEMHPTVGKLLSNLSAFLEQSGRHSEALATLREAIAIDDSMLGRVFSASSDRHRLAAIVPMRMHYSIYLSYVLLGFSGQQEAVDTTLDLVLRRKSITTEALAVQWDAVLGGRYPELVPLLERYRELTNAFIQAALAGPALQGEVSPSQVEELRLESERIEADLVQRIPEMRMERVMRTISRDDIARALPEGAVLIEYARFPVCRIAELRVDPDRYVALVFTASQGHHARFFDLGPAAEIDRLCREFLEAIATPPPGGTPASPGSEARHAIPSRRHAAGRDSGQRLREIVVDRISGAFGERKTLLICADGELNRIPFEALPTASGRFLIDDYWMSYLSVGRDLVRFQSNEAGCPSKPLVLADPDFDLAIDSSTGPAPPPTTASGPDLAHPRISRDIGRLVRRFDRLRGTRLEGRIVARLLGVEPWMGASALEGRLKGCHSPSVLHLATHGFFLDDQGQPADEVPEILWQGGGRSGTSRLMSASLENPLLRSGLALSGANTWLRRASLPPEAEDGILTAADVALLDLAHTDLVVLSACETGLGTIQITEGVFGLRRAFVTAGAKTLVLSLWKVADKQTQQLMSWFYAGLAKGLAREKALREAKLCLRQRNPDPYYWAAFICQGQTGPLRWFAGKETNPKP
jgi:CHAT domain-containing protein/tetratricopeptide (TPR) repeat protein